MKRLAKYKGRTVNLIITDACSDEYVIVDNGKYLTVDKNDVEITNQSSITLNELGSIMGISVTNL